MKGSVASTVGYLAATFWKEIGAQACIHGADGSFPSGFLAHSCLTLRVLLRIIRVTSGCAAWGLIAPAVSAQGSESNLIL